jgi:hypothetical protein
MTIERILLNEWQIFHTFEVKRSNKKKKRNSGALVRQQTIPTERPQLVGEVIANCSG